MQDLRYGEAEILNFDIEKDLEIWPNKNDRNFVVKITLPEFCCLCPRSGYPDFASIYLEYIPNEYVVELKAIKLYINSFMNRHISHEDSINEIYSVLENKLKPKYIKIVGDFNPRGNVHTIIEISSDIVSKNFGAKKEPKGEKSFKSAKFDKPKFEKSEKFSKDKKPRSGAKKEPFAKIDRTSPKVIKK